MFAGLIAAAVSVVVLVAFFAWEDHDKRKREEAGLPPKKYHDITDHEVTTVYSIRNTKD